MYTFYFQIKLHLVFWQNILFALKLYMGRVVTDSVFVSKSDHNIILMFYFFERYPRRCSSTWFYTHNFCHSLIIARLNERAYDRAVLHVEARFLFLLQKSMFHYKEVEYSLRLLVANNLKLENIIHCKNKHYVWIGLKNKFKSWLMYVREV